MTPGSDIVASKREWAAYVRVSKTNGREGESFVSPRQQEDAIRAALSIKYDATVADEQVYVDLDRTGTDGNRPSSTVAARSRSPAPASAASST